MKPIEFFVPGRPIGQPRHRMTLRVEGGKPVAYTPRKSGVTAWKSLIGLMAKPHIVKRCYNGPVELSAVFLMPRPKRMMTDKYPDEEIFSHTIKPDLDNLLKAVKDALTEAGVWKDDCQVWRIDHAVKKYCSKRGRPGVWIKIIFKDDKEQSEE